MRDGDRSCPADSISWAFPASTNVNARRNGTTESGSCEALRTSVWVGKGIGMTASKVSNAHEGR